MSTATAPPSRGGDHRTAAVAQLRAVYGIGQAAAAARTDDDLLQFTAAAAREALGASSVSIERFELDRGLVRVLVNDGDLAPTEVELPEHETYSIDQYAAVRVMEEGMPGIVVSLDDTDVDPPELDLLRELGKHSSIQVPIMLEGKMWGELYATRSVDLPGFASSDIELAQAVAAQVAGGIAAGAHVRRVSELALLDSLTGLANRAAVEERLAAAVAGHLTDGRIVTVVICDVNSLKRVNDERGHVAGDRLLIRVGELLGVAASRLPGALAGRLGGDEFCLVAEELSPDTVIEVITELCRRAMSLPGGAGVACGIASTADDVGHVATPADLVRLADGAQYRAKRGQIRLPVVAGRSMPDLPLQRRTETAPGGDRRANRGQVVRSVGVAEVVEEVVELLDNAPASTAGKRMAVVGEAVSRLVDAASWWVSDAPPDGRILVPRQHGTYRAPLEPGSDRDRYFTPGEPVCIDDYPETIRAMLGGWFSASVGDESADPGERAMLVEAGYTGVFGAGGRGQGRDWLLEVFLDAESPPVPGLGPALRALVALALSGAR